MAIRLRLADGTSVESDSAKELVDFYSALNAAGKKNVTEVAGVPVIRDFTFSPLPDPPQEFLPRTGIALIKVLLPEVEPKDTAEVSKILGVKPRGIGGFVLSLANWGKRNGYAHKSNIVVKGRRQFNGKSIRTIALNKNFRQQLKEGKVAGMKIPD